MLSAVIPSILSYPALQLALQPVHQWYFIGPLALGTNPLNSSTPMADRDRTVSTFRQLTYHFNCDSQMGLLQPRMWWADIGADTLVDMDSWRYQPVIPGVPFIRWAMALPLRTTGSLWPSFDSARLVGLAVRQAYAIALTNDFWPFWAYLRTPPLLLGGDRPVKLPTMAMSCCRITAGS